MNKPERACGGCTECCLVMPISELKKPAGTACVHQRCGKGCSIYPSRPMSCRAWSCLWLRGAPLLRRPDRGHYVVDMIPDFVTFDPNDGSEPTRIPVLQVWLHPNHPEAHRDEGLRAFLEARKQIALIRLSATDGFLLLPPAVCSDGKWHEYRSENAEWEDEHDPLEVFSVWNQGAAKQ